VKYFAYGSNMNPKRMKERGINYSSREFAYLENFKLVFNKKAQKGNYVFANIQPTNNEIVEGALYEFPDEELKLLDDFESYPRHYYRKEIVVINNANDEIQAWVYIAQPAHVVEGLFPQREYLNHILAGKDLLSASYFQKLNQIKTIEDLIATSL
jgi:gamma-glutamylcyclotransferase (GGCT)/AIG2-like uncharacterized protein YtfP